MPKFLLDLLPVINTNNDYQIELDNIPYNENESYTKVNQIFFSNKYGSFKLKGFAVRLTIVYSPFFSKTSLVFS